MLIVALSLAFLMTVAVMLAIYPFAAKIGLIDSPGGRKHHQGSIPVIGGLAMLFGTAIGLYLIEPPIGGFFSALAAGTLLVSVGVIDDRRGLSTAIRLLTQIAVVLIMIYGANLKLSNIGDPFGSGLISLGSFSVVFTLIVAITVINAFNLVDGLDGLAGVMSLIALTSVAMVAEINHLFGAAALVAASSIIGFLVFNFPVKSDRRMRSFMGDSGSTLLGLAVVWVTLGASQGASPVISPVHCLWFAALPIFDCLACFIKRVRHRKSPFQPGRDHAHHILARGGFSVGGILAILGGIQFLYATIGVAGHFVGVPDMAVFTAWAVLGLLHRTIIHALAKHHRLRKYTESCQRHLA